MKSLAIPKMWEFYELNASLKQSNHVYNFLRPHALEDAVQLICLANRYRFGEEQDFFDDEEEEYYNEERAFFDTAVKEFLDNEIDGYCSASASDYDYATDVAYAVSVATTITAKGPSVDIGKAVSIVESDVVSEVSDWLSRALSDLPPRFDYYRYDIPGISVSGADSLIESYLEDYGDDEFIEDEDTEDYSPIDAIFER